jgi:ferredoxin
VKLFVDPEQCTGHGRCYKLAPELLSPDEEGYVALRGVAVEVPAGQAELAEEIEGTCPEGAISLLPEE